jgi:hypothetical protein
MDWVGVACMTISLYVAGTTSSLLASMCARVQ